MKVNYLRISTIVLMFIIITGIFTGCEYRHGFNFAKELKKQDALEYVVDKKAIDPISKIDINTNIGDIKLVEDDDYYVEIHYNYWEDEPNYSLEDGNLNFDDSKVYPTSYSTNYDIKNSIIIYLPKDSDLEQIFLETSSGDVSIASFLTDNLDVEVSYGDLSIKNASAKKSNINMSSGNSEISFFNSINLEYENSYGNSSFTNINASENILLTKDSPGDSIAISMSSGNCIMNNIVSNSLEIENSYGNITCKELAVGDFDSNLSSGDLTVTESIVEDFDIENSYGNVTLSLTGIAEDYMLDLNTSYGKIDVDNTSYEAHLIRENGGNKKIEASLSSGDLKLNFE